MEIGSFIELQFAKGKELYKGDDVARLNTGRAAIAHAIECLGVDKIYLPVYQCPSVKEFLSTKGYSIEFYNINSDFLPILEMQDENSAILIVNYFGIFSHKEIVKRASRFKNVIIDNCPAFYNKPLTSHYNIYSTRKFFGVPDGAYCIGPKACHNLEYKQDFSSDTAGFLLQRIEYGCEGKVYEEREKNEHRLDSSDINLMSKLTQTILDGIDYEEVKNIRRKNFKLAHSIFSKINQLDPMKYYDSESVPMVYPLMTQDKNLAKRLITAKHFQGNWWKSVAEDRKANEFEKRLSQYMVPITIDQRYGPKALDYIKNIIIP